MYNTVAIYTYSILYIYTTSNNAEKLSLGTYREKAVGLILLYELNCL